MKIHPAAAKLPEIPAIELEALRLSIERDGLIYPILVDTKGQIIDGRHRDKACKAAGIEPHTETFQGNEEQIIARIRALNLRRRDLTPSQKAFCDVALSSFLTRGGDRKTENFKTSREGLNESASHTGQMKARQNIDLLVNATAKTAILADVAIRAP